MNSEIILFITIIITIKNIGYITDCPLFVF